MSPTRRHATDYGPLRASEAPRRCPECGASANVACESWCTGGRGRSRWFYLEAAITFALFCVCVYLGAGGEAWPR